jgi:hypothetical protein
VNDLKKQKTKEKKAMQTTSQQPNVDYIFQATYQRFLDNLGISDYERRSFIFEQGFQYLEWFELVERQDHEHAATLKNSPIFWRFWFDKAMVRDLLFKSIHSKIVKKHWLDYWRDYHSLQNLKNDKELHSSYFYQTDAIFYQIQKTKKNATKTNQKP